jgi:molybdenum cofactor cytidylyltransferase
MADVAALVLAAGAGARFAASGGQGPKVLALHQGRPLLAHVLDVATAAGLDPVVLVVPADLIEDAAMVAADPQVRIVVNPRAAEGIATSLVVGLAALGASADVAACVVLLADQPAIDPAVMARVVERWRRTGRPARARYDDGPGHPVLLPRDRWDTVRAGLRDAAVDEGARRVLTGLEVEDVPVAGPMPVDVDRPDDLDRLSASRAADGTGRS